MKWRTSETLSFLGATPRVMRPQGVDRRLPQIPPSQRGLSARDADPNAPSLQTDSAALRVADEKSVCLPNQRLQSSHAAQIIGFILSPTPLSEPDTTRTSS